MSSSRVLSQLCAGALSLSLLTQPLAALAEEPPSAPAPVAPPTLESQLTGAAKDAYLSGKAVYQAGDAAGALIKFQRAYELSNDARLLYNVASCEVKLHHYARGLAAVRRYQQEWGPHSSAEERAEAARFAENLRELVSEVTLKLNEDAASVYVDDELVGKTPLSGPLEIDLGKHRLRIAKPGFRELSVERSFTGAATTELELTLQREARPKAPSAARISIASANDSAIELDHALVGHARWSGSVAPGPHEVTISAPGMKTYRGRLEARAGETRSLDIVLQPDKRGLPLYVWLAGSAVVAAGLGTGAYFLFRPEPATSKPTYVGSIGAGQVQLP
jgi:hypothetical protein